MTSRKPSARARQIAAFKTQPSGLDDLFAHEREHEEELAAQHDEALFNKACASKQRYASKAEALDAIRRCAEHGRRGLRCYRCSYCGGWHLTSKPPGN